MTDEAQDRAYTTTSPLHTAASAAVAGTAAVCVMDRVGWWMHRHTDSKAFVAQLIRPVTDKAQLRDAGEPRSPFLRQQRSTET